MNTETKLKEELKNLKQDEKDTVLNWALEVQQIQKNRDLNKKEKIYELRQLNNKKAFLNAFSISKTFFIEKWKNANWTKKLALIGGAIGLSIAGSQGAGIAALGGAIGVPFFLVTAGGGALVGIIIETLDPNSKKK